MRCYLPHRSSRRPGRGCTSTPCCLPRFLSLPLSINIIIIIILIIIIIILIITTISPPHHGVHHTTTPHHGVHHTTTPHHAPESAVVQRRGEGGGEGVVACGQREGVHGAGGALVLGGVQAGRLRLLRLQALKHPPVKHSSVKRPPVKHSSVKPSSVKH